MIELYLIETPKQLIELSTHQQENNLFELANTAHAIKGSSSHFYANQVVESANALEKAARTEQTADFYSLTNALNLAVTDLLNQLKMTKD